MQNDFINTLCEIDLGCGGCLRVGAVLAFLRLLLGCARPLPLLSCAFLLILGVTREALSEEKSLCTLNPKPYSHTSGASASSRMLCCARPLPLLPCALLHILIGETVSRGRGTSVSGAGDRFGGWRCHGCPESPQCRARATVSGKRLSLCTKDACSRYFRARSTRTASLPPTRCSVFGLPMNTALYFKRRIPSHTAGHKGNLGPRWGESPIPCPKEFTRVPAVLIVAGPIDYPVPDYSINPFVVRCVACSPPLRYLSRPTSSCSSNPELQHHGITASPTLTCWKNRCTGQHSLASVTGRSILNPAPQPLGPQPLTPCPNNLLGLSGMFLLALLKTHRLRCNQSVSQGRFAFKAYRPVYHSTLRSGVTKKEEEVQILASA